MKMTMFKKCLITFLSLCMLMSIAVPFSVSANTEVFVSNLQTTSFIGDAYKANADFKDAPITFADGKSFQKGVSLSANWNTERNGYFAIAEYDISGISCNRFSATIGSLCDYINADLGFKYHVYADDSIVYTTAAISHDKGSKEMATVIPEGTKKLTLILETIPTNICGTACFADAKLYTNDGTDGVRPVTSPYFNNTGLQPPTETEGFVLDGIKDLRYKSAFSMDFRKDTLCFDMNASQAQDIPDDDLNGNIYYAWDGTYIWFYVEVEDSYLVPETVDSTGLHGDYIDFFLDNDPQNNESDNPYNDIVSENNTEDGIMKFRLNGADLLLRDYALKHTSKFIAEKNLITFKTEKGYGFELKWEVKDPSSFQFNCVIATMPRTDETLGKIDGYEFAVGAGWWMLYDFYHIVNTADYPQWQNVFTEGDAPYSRVIDAINEIGITTYAKKQQIADARAAYDELNDDMKSLVNNIEKLEAAEGEIAEMEKNAADVHDLIAAIGEVTKDSGKAIENARKAYNKLIDDEKGLVDNLGVLEAAEKAYALIPKTDPGDVDGVAGISAADALVVLQCAVGKTELSDELRDAADVNKDGDVTAADALLVLQFAVGKIQSF